jgi:uncharacterized membrane protein
MHEYMLFLRIIHIVLAVFWGGTAIMLHVFFFPAMNKLGPDGGKVMQIFMATRKFPLVMLIAGLLTVLSGLAMMDHLSNHFTAEWFDTKYAICLTLGGVFGLFAFFIAWLWNKPSADKMRKTGMEIAAAGGPPTQEQTATMIAMRGRIVLGVKGIAYCILIATITMGMARYI